MDSLQGISVEHKLYTFNKPRTGTTLCHPKIGYVDLTRNPVLDTLALNLPLGHLNGDNAYSPKYQTRNSRWHPKFNSYNCNMSFIKMQRTQSLTRPTTHAAISTSHNSFTHPTSILVSAATWFITSTTSVNHQRLVGISEDPKTQAKDSLIQIKKKTVIKV